MTVDEMIDCIHICDLRLEFKIKEQIIAALRAGQQMRIAHYNRVGMAEACAAWDRMTKGEG